MPRGPKSLNLDKREVHLLSSCHSTAVLSGPERPPAHTVASALLQPALATFCGEEAAASFTEAHASFTCCIFPDCFVSYDRRDSRKETAMTNNKEIIVIKQLKQLTFFYSAA